MSPRNDPDEPRVRPISPLGSDRWQRPIEPALGEEPDPRPIGGRAAVVVIGLIGVVVGFFLASSFGGNAPEPEEPVEIAAPEPTAAPTTTAAVPTTNQPATLRQLAPGFTGALYLTTGGLGQQAVVHVWPANAVAPRRIGALPDGVDVSSIAWDADRSSLAAIDPVPAGGILYAGALNDMTPVSLNASSFAWHSDRARHIAWTERGPDGEVLSVLDLADPGSGAVVVGAVPGGLVSWGDWGFLVSGFSEGSQLIALAPDGSRRNSSPGGAAGRLNTAYADAQILGGVTDPRASLLLVDPETGLPMSLDEPVLGAVSVVVSPGTRQVAWIEQTGARDAVLRIAGFDGGVRFAEEVTVARVLDWTTEGRYLLLESLISRIDEDSIFRPLFLVDVTEGTVAELPIQLLDILGAAVDAN